MSFVNCVGSWRCGSCRTYKYRDSTGRKMKYSCSKQRRPSSSSAAAAQAAPQPAAVAIAGPRQDQNWCNAINLEISPFACLLPYMILLLLLSFAEPAHGDWLMDCGDCHCKWNSGKKTADCKNLSLASVPENLSSEVQVLDLSFNRISVLEQNAFLNAQLHNLHKLYIRNSSLQQIDPRTFTQLEILIELDLSNNLLRSLQANLFVRLVKVRALVLNGNLLESLGDGIFQNLKYLHKVELKSNRLTRIGTRVFDNVPLLTQIYLNGNRLSFLRKESFESLDRLAALSLDQNPWNCTCELQIFRDFVLKRNLYTPPTSCYYPVHLRGMLWVEDQPEAFACKPRIIYPARGASINTSKENVTLICRVHASPTTLIAWDYNKQMYRANTVGGGQQQRVHIQLLRDEQSKEKEFGRDVFISRLTILGAEKSDEGIYTCLAENAGGKDAVQMSLLVQKPGPRDLMLQSNLMIVIALMALGLLSISVFLAMVTCCIYKRFKSNSPTHQHQHHHHRPHHQLDVGDGNQLTAATSTTLTGVHHATTTLTGGTDVEPGMRGDGVGTRHGSGDREEKTKLNGDPSGKYAELLKQTTTGGVGLHAVDRAYLERSSEDKLHIKFPHGTGPVEINRHGPTNNNNNAASAVGGSNSSHKRHAETNGGIGEFQPDLLPTYATSAMPMSGTDHRKAVADRDRERQLYSPLKATTTINQHRQQPQGHEDAQQYALYAAPKTTKYNSSVQEYLQARSGGYAPPTKSQLNTARSSEKLGKFGGDPAAIALATCSSLSTATSVVVATDGVAFGAATLQRHSKSLALPSHRLYAATAAAVTMTASTPTDTPSKCSSVYEYRQPPPPPYNAAHRTTNSLMMQQQANRRTSVTEECSEGGSYRGDGQLDVQQQQQQGVTRETIVTASPSLNFLTTTGAYGVPQRQLL